MSTTPQPTAAVDPTTLTPEQIAEQLANQPQTPPASAEPPQLQREYVVQLETGQVYKGRTQQEVIDQLKRAQEEASKTIKQLKTQQAPPPPAPTAPAAPKFDNNRYYELLAADPIAAQDYLDEIRYGVKSADIKRMVEESYGFVQTAKPQVIVSNWMASSDFPSDDQESIQKFQEAWSQMGFTDADVSERNLTLVHSYCKANNLYPQAAPQPTAATGMVNQPLPTMTTTSGANTPEPEFNAVTATPEQIKAYMEKVNPTSYNYF